MPIIFDEQIDYILENDSVLLRPITQKDFTNLLPFALNEPDTWKYSLVSAAGGEGMKKYIETAIEERIAKKAYCFIVYDKLTNKYAGSTRFYGMQMENKTLLLGYTWYGKEFRGTGLNTKCKLLLLEFAFEKMGMERVEFRADNNNEISKAAMKSIGCIEEGILRSDMPAATGGRRDSIVFSILKHEWESGVKEKLVEKIKRGTK